MHCCGISCTCIFIPEKK